LITQDDAKHLLGKSVEVVLCTDGPENDGPVIAKGTMLSFSAMGEVVLQGDDGDLHYCWPMLDVRPA
jgi:hypothetical protein